MAEWWCDRCRRYYDGNHPVARDGSLKCLPGRCDCGAFIDLDAEFTECGACGVDWLGEAMGIDDD